MKETWGKLKLISVRNSNYNSVGCLELVYVNLNESCLIFIKTLANLFRILNMNLGKR
jgi:hypothetical protein